MALSLGGLQVGLDSSTPQWPLREPLAPTHSTAKIQSGHTDS